MTGRRRAVRNNPRRPAGPVADSWVGRRLEVEVLRVAHGGHCVARHDGRVVFVRHALPGERVLVEITEDAGGSFCRGDAVEVLSPSADRVDPPCRYARPGGCGGCDWQHVTPAAQRELKRAVVAEQLHRLAGVEWTGPVRAVEPLTGWRTRMQYAVAGDRLGLRRHRSHEVIEIEQCLIAAPGAGPQEARAALDAHAAAESGDAVEVTVLGGSRTVDLIAPRRRRTRIAGVDVTPYAAGRTFQLPRGGFWQVHPRAADVLTETVLELAGAQPGERVLDLYSGVGLFAAALAERVGPDGQVTAMEGHRGAAEAASANLAGLPARSVHAAVTPEALADHEAVDIVVLDPPRTGAKAPVCEAISALQPRVIVYVACDPAALARDAAVLVGHGWSLTELRAFDLFPMTHHVECVAQFRRDGALPARSEADAPSSG